MKTTQAIKCIVNNITYMMCKYKNISISESNYKTLKTMGQAGDSFNDVLTDKLIKLLGPKFEEGCARG